MISKPFSEPDFFADNPQPHNPPPPTPNNSSPSSPHSPPPDSLAPLSPAPPEVSNNPFNLPICFFSNNVNKSNTTTHTLLNVLINAYNILLIQEPWKNQIGLSKSDTDPEGSAIHDEPQQKEWSHYSPLPSETGKNKPTHTSIYFSKRLSHVKVSQRTDILEHPDITIIHLETPMSELFMFNIYNDTSNSAMKALLTTTLPNAPIILSGDFNLHHDLWMKDDRLPPTSRNAEDLVEWAETNTFHLLNEKGEITFLRSNASSVLNLTWANDLTFASDLISDWQINYEYLFGQDYIPVTWTLHLSFPPSDPIDEQKFIFKDDNCGDWCSAFQDKLGDLPSQDHDPAHWETITDKFIAAMTHTSIVTSLPSRGKAKPSPWFNKEVKTAIQKVKETRLAGRLARKPNPHLPFPEDKYLRYRKVVRQLNRTVKKAKCDWAMVLCEEIGHADIWKLTSWYKGVQKHKSPPLNTPTGTAYNSKAKFNILFQTFFTTPPNLDLPPYPSHHPPITSPAPSSQLPSQRWRMP